MNIDFKELTSDAIRYWEPRRVIYNFVLAGIVIGYFIMGIPESWERMQLDFVLWVFILAIIANILYCLIYLPDIFAQVSHFRPLWIKIRWFPFVIGLAVAAIITRWLCIGMFLHK